MILMTWTISSFIVLIVTQCHSAPIDVHQDSSTTDIESSIRTTVVEQTDETTHRQSTLDGDIYEVRNAHHESTSRRSVNDGSTTLSEFEYFDEVSLPSSTMDELPTTSSPVSSTFDAMTLSNDGLSATPKLFTQIEQEHIQTHNVQHEVESLSTLKTSTVSNIYVMEKTTTAEPSSDEFDSFTSRVSSPNEFQLVLPDKSSVVELELNTSTVLPIHEPESSSPEASSSNESEVHKSQVSMLDEPETQTSAISSSTTSEFNTSEAPLLFESVRKSTELLDDDESEEKTIRYGLGQSDQSSEESESDQLVIQTRSATGKTD